MQGELGSVNQPPFRQSWFVMHPGTNLSIIPRSWSISASKAPRAVSILSAVSKLQGVQTPQLKGHSAAPNSQFVPSPQSVPKSRHSKSHSGSVKLTLLSLIILLLAGYKSSLASEISKIKSCNAITNITNIECLIFYILEWKIYKLKEFEKSRRKWFWYSLVFGIS